MFFHFAILEDRGKRGIDHEKTDPMRITQTYKLYVEYQHKYFEKKTFY